MDSNLARVLPAAAELRILLYNRRRTDYGTAVCAELQSWDTWGALGKPHHGPPIFSWFNTVLLLCLTQCHRRKSMF